MRILFAGTPDVAIPALSFLVDDPSHEVVGVLTRPDAQKGRGRHLAASPVGQWADQHGLPTYKPASSSELLDVVTELKPDVAVVVAYGRILTQPVLDAVQHGWINAHFSILPRWRGASPVQYAIRHGDSHSGITIFRIVKDLDAGPVYIQQPSPISPDDTAQTLLDRLSRCAGSLIQHALTMIENGEEPSAQPDGEITYAGRITTEDLKIDWRQPSAQIVNLIRSASPEPGAWTVFQGTRLRIIAASPDPSGEPLACRRLHIGKKSVVVGTEDGINLRLEMVKPAGKKTMAGADWGRGLHIESDDCVFADE